MRAVRQRCRLVHVFRIGPQSAGRFPLCIRRRTFPYHAVPQGYDGKVYEPEDLTALLSNNDELVKKINKKALFKNLTVVDYTYNWDGSGTRDDSDIYLNVTAEDGTAATFVVRRYLTDNNSDVFKAVEALVAGDVVDLSAFVYWYNGPQCRIIEVNKH